MNTLVEAKHFLEASGVGPANIGVVLGTGLHSLVDAVEVDQCIPYSAIPGFPVSTVEFHKGNLIYASIGDQKLLIMQGRFHLYEGYSMEQIVMPVQLMAMFGVEYLFLSNAAGGINPQFKKGDLVLIEDHINLLGVPYLVKSVKDKMANVLNDNKASTEKMPMQLMEERSTALGIVLKKGVYAAVPGPNLETSAEYRFLGIIGADMVGMSTVPELLAAAQLQMACVAISVITDECDPDHLQPINIAEIIEVAGKADKVLSKLFVDVINAL